MGNLQTKYDTSDKLKEIEKNKSFRGLFLGVILPPTLRLPLPIPETACTLYSALQPKSGKMGPASAERESVLIHTFAQSVPIFMPPRRLPRASVANNRPRLRCVPLGRCRDSPGHRRPLEGRGRRPGSRRPGWLHRLPRTLGCWVGSAGPRSCWTGTAAVSNVSMLSCAMCRYEGDASAQGLLTSRYLDR